MLKKCAVCGTEIQDNIIFNWKRHSDEKVFHICSVCAEDGKVNQNTVKTIITSTHTTVKNNSSNNHLVHRIHRNFTEPHHR